MAKPDRVRSALQDGIGAADENLTGAAMRDAQEIQASRRNPAGKPSRSAYIADIMSSLVNGVSNVPDSLATSIMVGVNPIYGLYATILAPIVGGILARSQLMIVRVTVASAMMGGQTIASIAEPDKLPSLFALVLMSGLFLILFGFLKLGRLRKFISYAVMRGFLYGVGVLLILGQSPALFGYEATGSNAVLTFWDTITHIGSWDLASIGISILTLALIILIRRTPLKSFSSALALLWIS